ncbi:hypothetical protein RFI_03577, partial [Reticulomyxa filosa]
MDRVVVIKTIADARRAKQNRKKETAERILVHETSILKEKNKTNENIYTNKTSQAKKDNENEEMNATKEKLKQYYQSQDKLAPLFDDPEQSINTCYIRKGKSEENEKYKEENGKWINLLNYSLIYGNQTETIELQDIWNDKQTEAKICHISIRGEAGSGKSVLSQRIAYLWGNGQMWDQFQYLLHIPLRKIINIFHQINDNSDDQKKDESNCDIEYLWSVIMNGLHIPQWNLNDTKC